LEIESTLYEIELGEREGERGRGRERERREMDGWIETIAQQLL
jgi:hypothetical protein